MKSLPIHNLQFLDFLIFSLMFHAILIQKDFSHVSLSIYVCDISIEYILNTFKEKICIYFNRVHFEIVSN